MFREKIQGNVEIFAVYARSMENIEMGDIMGAFLVFAKGWDGCAN